MQFSTDKVFTLDSQRCPCGGSHAPQDHSEFLASMPQSPADLADDLIKMGVYRPQVLKLADQISRTEMLETLVLERFSRRNPEKEPILRELIWQAGGLDQAMVAAFGPQAAEFFTDTLRTGSYSRRRFLTQVLVAASVIGLAATQGQQELSVQAQGSLEKTDLRIGFIPITCATPIIMAKPLKFYEKHGLNVQLVKMPSWVAVRDSAIAGELDAYHMLSPMPIAITLGLGSTAFPIRVASLENINGQAITIANKYKNTVKGPADFKGFTIGVPFPYSMHNLLLRYYLAVGGLNPDTDVQINPVPPPDSVARMAVGDIDAMLMPDPFNQRAVFEGVGFIHMLSKDLWPGHPCCVFAAGQSWIDANSNTFRAVNKAIIDAASYASQSGNRAEIAKAISPREFLNQPEAVVTAVLTGQFEDGLGNSFNIPNRIDFDPYPWQSFAYWIISQLVRWNLLSEADADYPQITQDIFLTDLARELARELGQNPPTENLRVETLKFDTFDPSNPVAYIQAQIEKFGV
ncbi:ABC transporter substrate-binding protein [Synechococcus sp. H55.7]|uniref:CmpA/NrtA family ABC transporter substrate-binding protein n=1 Tax=unclassified Synechococcus TaxID=2626047 RepID=UPI0039C3B034